MNTENLKTLKIHKLSQEQYERELLAGNVDPNALYLTPDDGDADSITVNLDGTVEGEANPINADTLNGRAASEYALKSDLENLPSGGVSSWNDLTDKPFEEIITTGDTLTWDGDMSGLVSLVTWPHFKVSDNVPTVEDFANGYEFTLDYGRIVTNVEYPLYTDEEGAIYLGYSDETAPAVVIVPNDETSFGQKGVYFINPGNFFVKSLTIPGYNHFENKVIKTLEPKYMPEYLQLKESTIETDTLTWDGDMSGLVSLGTWPHFKVSDNVPTVEDFANGYEFTLDYGRIVTSADYPLYTTEEGVIYLGNGVVPMGPLVLIVPNDETSFGQKGVYFINFAGAYVKSLKIPGYTFVIKETKLAKKYIPEDTETKARLYTLENSNIKNIIANSDFLNPINHREFESGEIGNGDFFIDGWSCYNAEDEEKLNVVIDLPDLRGVVLQPTTNAYMAQYLQNFADRYYNRTLTVSICVDNHVYTGSATIPRGPWEMTTIIDNDSFEVKVHARSGVTGLLLIRAKKEITIQHVGLYYGNMAPAEHLQKSHEEELLASRVAETSNAGQVDPFGVSMELLWENASPNSSFVGQTISLDWTKYSKLELLSAFRPGMTIGGDNGALMRSVDFIDCSLGTIMIAREPITGSTNAYRKYTLLDGKIKIENGASENSGGGITAENSYMVPIKIYGMK